MAEPDNAPAVLLVLHDVAPQTWADYRPFVEVVDALGNVPITWLMSEGTRQALRQLPLSYTSDAQHLYRLPDFTPIAAPGLVWSARSAWHRGLSKMLSDRREQRWQHEPVIRLGLHPMDMRHDFSRCYWLDTLRRMLNGGRRPLTKAAWLATQP